MKTYKTYSFSEKTLWSEVPESEIEFYQWNSEASYKTCFKMCTVKGKGIFLKMRTDEKNLRAVCTERDEPIWEDSCMEFFIKPFSFREEYLNFEMNPNGAYLCEFGKGKSDRVFVKTLTDKTPTVITSKNSAGWELDLFVPCELINEVYGEKFTAEQCDMKGNFYKCGDKTEKVHYGSFAKMTTLPPGFHNPKCFANIIVTDY